MVNSRWLNANGTGDFSTASDPALAGKVKQCYNDIQAAGSSLTLSNSNSGITKTVSVTGGSSANINALNNATLASNTITFTSTTGASADEVNVDLASSTLAASVASNLGNITLLHSNVATNVANIANNVTDIATNAADIATNVTNISALETNTLNCFESASISGSNLTLTPLSGTATTLTLPAGGTASNDAITFDITVQVVGIDNKYFINGIQGSLLPIELLLGHKYIFNYPVGHPLRFSTTNDGIHNSGVEYTHGITHNSPNGVQTQTEIVVNSGRETLYYYCPNHDEMGGLIIQAGLTCLSNVTYDNTGIVPKLNLISPFIPDKVANLPNFYIGSSITGQVITLNKAVGSADTITIPPAVPVATRNVFHPSTMTTNIMGTAIASASSTKSNPSYTNQYEPYHAFDNDDTEDWVTSSNLYSSTDGSYSGSANLGTNADNGEWLKIDLVNPMKAIALNLKKADNYIKPASTFPIDVSSGWANTFYYQLDTAQTTTNSVFYELYRISNGARESPDEFGLEFRRESNGTTKVYCNTANNNYAPFYLSIGSSGTQSDSVTISGHVGTVVYTYDSAGGGYPLQFLITADLLFYPEAEIKDFKLYGSVYGTNWVQLLSKTNATIANTGTNYTFTNTTDYQYYGLVVTKTNISHNNNVSLGQMSLAIEEVFPVPPCLAKGSFVKPRDTSFTAAIAGTLSNAFNISSITQTSNSPLQIRYGVWHRNYKFQATFTTALTDSNYQVILSELTEFSVSSVYYGTLLSLSVRNKTTTGFDIHVLADELGKTTYNPEFGFDIVVF